MKPPSREAIAIEYGRRQVPVISARGHDDVAAVGFLDGGRLGCILRGSGVGKADRKREQRKVAGGRHLSLPKALPVFGLAVLSASGIVKPESIFNLKPESGSRIWGETG